jgi:hypothetical protein
MDDTDADLIMWIAEAMADKCLLIEKIRAPKGSKIKVYYRLVDLGVGTQYDDEAHLQLNHIAPTMKFDPDAFVFEDEDFINPKSSEIIETYTSEEKLAHDILQARSIVTAHLGSDFDTSIITPRPKEK